MAEFAGGAPMRSTSSMSSGIEQDEVRPKTVEEWLKVDLPLRRKKSVEKLKDSTLASSQRLAK